MKLYRLHEPSLAGLHMVEEADPIPGPRDVLVRIHAASLNYKDLLFVRPPDEGGIALPRPTVPLSDAAGEVVAVGDGVTRFAVGDSVIPVVVQDWFDGPIPADSMQRALGVGVDGVMSELRTFDQQNLVALPSGLSFQEGSTLPIAAVTAWNAVQHVAPHDSVLVLGTGGVALFAAQFSRAAGARVILCTSSEDKAERARTLGVDDTVNYTEHPEWEREVLALTEGRGVDHVIETVGGSSLQRSVNASTIGGSVYAIGLIDRGPIDPYSIQYRAVTVRGIRMGARSVFEAMNRVIEQHAIRPVIDSTIPFSDLPEAYRRIDSGEHFGKVVVTLG